MIQTNKLILSEFHFRHSVVCCLVFSPTRIAPIRVGAEQLWVPEKHCSFSFLNEWINQWFFYNDSPLICLNWPFWMNCLNALFNESLIKTGTCRHLLVVVLSYLLMHNKPKPAKGPAQKHTLLNIAELSVLFFYCQYCTPLTRTNFIYSTASHISYLISLIKETAN